MDARAREIIAQLALEPHPEGGYYRRVFCSGEQVQRARDGHVRPAMTSIFYLLTDGEAGTWHRVHADEAWHFHEGAPLVLTQTDSDGHMPTRCVLGPLGADTRPQHVVPAHCWQHARTLGAFTLVGCSVGPGFDFADFTLIDDLPDAAMPLRRRLLAIEA